MGTWITEEEEYTIRYSESNDLPALRQWISQPEVMIWYPVSSVSDAEIMTANWIGFSRFRASLTAVYRNREVGIATLFLMPYRKLIHHSLMYFVVAPGEWGKGIGTSLLRNIHHLAKTEFRFEKIHAEVYSGCPAIPLFEKAGYREVVRQERAVKESDGSYRARLIMEIELTADQAKASKEENG
ncbi:MAG: GNAT family protein [Chlamydiota bacterium]